MAVRQVHLLLGQSNMVGEGAGTPPTYTWASRIYKYSQPWDSGLSIPIDSTNPGGGTWGAASDPLHSTPACTVGPGMAYANKLIDTLGDYEIGLVPCAWTGRGLKSYWEPGYSNLEAYSNGMARGNAAKSWATDGNVSGIVFYAGETDAQAASVTYWPTLIAQTFTDMRCELGNLTIPIVIVVPGPITAGGYPSIATVQQYVREMAGCSPRVGVADASDLTTFDGLHLTQASEVTLGIRIANKMYEIAPSPYIDIPTPAGDPPPSVDTPISSAPNPEYLFDSNYSTYTTNTAFEFWGGKFWTTNKVVSRFIIKSRADLPFVYHYGGAGHYKWFLEGWNNTEWIVIKTGTVEYTRLTEVDTEGAFIQTVIDQSTTDTTPYIKHRVRLWSVPNLEDGSPGTDQANVYWQISEIVFYT